MFCCLSVLCCRFGGQVAEHLFVEVRISRIEPMKTAPAERAESSRLMSRQFVNLLADGDPVEETYLLADKQLRANRNANLYLLAQLRDRSGVISGLMWNVVEESVANVHSGDFVRVKGKVQ